MVTVWTGAGFFEPVVAWNEHHNDTTGQRLHENGADEGSIESKRLRGAPNADPFG